MAIALNAAFPRSLHTLYLTVSLCLVGHVSPRAVLTLHLDYTDHATMASYQAISTVTNAVIRLLRKNYRPEDFDGNELSFEIFQAKDFEKSTVTAGVSLFLYRLMHNGTQRLPPGRPLPNGRRAETLLPLDLHFFLTVWGTSPSLQHTIAGWMMRVLEDTPILPSGLLNEVLPGSFANGENVELSLVEMTTEDLLRLWETLVPSNYYELSVPYVARAVRIESLVYHETHPAVASGQIRLAHDGAGT